MKKLTVTILTLFFIFSLTIAHGEASAAIGSQQEILSGIYIYSDLWNEYVETSTGTDITFEPSRFTATKSADADGDAIFVFDGISTHWNTVTRDIYSMQVSLVKTSLATTAALSRAAAVIATITEGAPESDEADINDYLELLGRLTDEAEAFMSEMESGARSHTFTVTGRNGDFDFYLIYTGNDMLFSTIPE